MGTGSHSICSHRLARRADSILLQLGVAQTHGFFSMEESLVLGTAHFSTEKTLISDGNRSHQQAEEEKKG